ncbi:uncharacterized protein LOC114302057 [Camellia sinensis]|uniref:uncharacterized protein LOC114302057 n=1 Tax=Camellia sinensis TaxID=4442 RepID=UPI001035B7DC|nr:uncharacterized protein LOC114302057 [Camellia sinensis]
MKMKAKTTVALLFLENGTLEEYKLGPEGVNQALLAGELFEMYSELWALDAKDPFMKPECGESVSDVVSRLTSALITIESEFQGCAILVVSHGDPLQILQTILNAAKEHTGPNVDDLTSRIQAVKVPSVLSLHRKFSLLTGELWAVL